MNLLLYDLSKHAVLLIYKNAIKECCFHVLQMWKMFRIIKQYCEWFGLRNRYVTIFIN